MHVFQRCFLFELIRQTLVVCQVWLCMLDHCETTWLDFLATGILVQILCLIHLWDTIWCSTKWGIHRSSLALFGVDLCLILILEDIPFYQGGVCRRAGAILPQIFKSLITVGQESLWVGFWASLEVWIVIDLRWDCNHVFVDHIWCYAVVGVHHSCVIFTGYCISHHTLRPILRNWLLILDVFVPFILCDVRVEWSDLMWLNVSKRVILNLGDFHLLLLLSFA